jgi:hypothetical protein
MRPGCGMILTGVLGQRELAFPVGEAPHLVYEGACLR